MSRKNIVAQQKLSTGRVLVTFEVGDHEYRHYTYSARAGAAIAAGRDPQKAKFVAHEVKVKEK